MTEPVFPEQFSEETTIQFFSEDIDFTYPDPEKAQRWIEKVAEDEQCRLAADINFIFCSDNYLHQLNIDYLEHDTLTDIITFPYNQPPLISGDIFISIDRVKENARLYNVPFAQELHRVIIHGILHLCGYRDKTTDEQAAMRTKENEALQLLDALS